jgi:hypothetical protein
MVVVLVFHWFAVTMKTSMVVSAIPNVKLVTLELVQCAGKIAGERQLMLEQHAPRNPMAELLVSQ